MIKHPPAFTSTGAWFISMDNDLLAQSDDDYTNGLQAGWVSGYLARYTDGQTGSK